MENITLGQIALILGGIVALIKSIEYLYHKFVKWADAWLEKGIQPILDKQIQFEDRIARLELYDMRMELMRLLTLADKGVMTQEEKIHLHSMYDIYKNDGGNSYVHTYFDKLKKEGKI